MELRAATGMFYRYLKATGQMESFIAFTLPEEVPDYLHTPHAHPGTTVQD